MNGIPRRKVVHSYQDPTQAGNTVYFNCTLTCGHTVTAYGLKDSLRPNSPKRVAPKTATCHYCRTNPRD